MRGYGPPTLKHLYMKDSTLVGGPPVMVTFRDNRDNIKQGPLILLQGGGSS